MKTLGKIYNVTSSKEKLVRKFNSNEVFCDAIRTMADSHVIVLDALIDGMRITRSGNNVTADFETTSLQSIIFNLKENYYLPISKIEENVPSSMSNRTIDQAIYYMSDNDLNNIINNYDFIVEHNKSIVLSKRESRTEKMILRLIRSVGDKEAIKKTFIKAFDGRLEKDSINQFCQQIDSLDFINKNDDWR